MATLTVNSNSSGSGGIPTLLDTNLNINPYFDDFDARNQYYKVLFKPGTAVQVRELNQLQTILQNQIASFGQNIFKEGSVIKGCSFTFDDNYNYVKLTDTYANTSALTIADLQDLIVTNSNGLKGVVLNTTPGLVSSDPDLNTIYIKYLNSASYANGSTQSSFDSGETLSFATVAGTSQGNVVVASVTNATGTGYAFTTSEGIIFKKGYFIYVTPQTTVIDKYNNQPDNISVGFEAKESLISANYDSSLFDNAAGAPNYAAPGADRLKMEPILVTRNTNESNTTTFFSLVDFKLGLPVTIRNDTQFNSITIEEAQRIYEINGDFVVYPFNLSSKSLANTSDPDYSTYYNATVSKGLGYVEGFRVEFINNNIIKARRGTDKASLAGQRVSLSMGYYVYVNEFSGSFGDSFSIIQVELHNTSKKSISNKGFLSSSYSTSTRIGTAYIKGVDYYSGTQGAYDGQYKVYLFNITMTPGTNFSDVESVIYYNSGIKGVGDVVLTYNSTTSNYYAAVNSTTLKTMLFPFGQKAITSDGFGSINFNYKKIATPTFNSPTNAFSSASLTITTPGGASYNDSSYYTGTLSSSQMNEIIVIPNSTAFVNNYYISGNVDVYSATNVAISPNTAGVNSTSQTIKFSTASNRFRINDEVLYTVSTGNTAISGLTGNTNYYVSFANATDIALSLAPGGSNLYITETRTAATAEAGHTMSSYVGYVYKNAGTTTAFGTNYAVGDFITIDNSTLKQIVSIANNDFMTVDSAFNADLSNKTHTKTFPAGVPIPFANRTNRSIVIDDTGTQLTLNIGEYIDSSFTAQVSSAVNRGNAKSIKKQINKGIYVKINCATHVNGNRGPWSLGLSDILSVDAVYVDQTGSSYSVNNTDYSKNFSLDNGQRDAHYDLGYLKLNTGSFGLSNAATILVELSTFSVTSGEGVGFFTCNSYPIDDTNYNNQNAITTVQIPSYTTSDGSFIDLRDVVDFRPVGDATATITTSTSSASINPSSSLTFSSPPYLPKSDSLFVSDIAYYLSRTDRIALDTNGNLVIKEGLPGVYNPVAPPEQPKTMTLGLVKVPPYPSLTTNEALSLNRYDNAIQIQPVQQRRFTMADIGRIEHRITNLEYYTSLSLLEQSAASLQIRSTTTGQTRFQNGIFVDGFNGADLSNTKAANYNIAIDGLRTEIRPSFFQLGSEFAVDLPSSTNIVQSGDLVMLNHTSDNVYINQNYASKYRSCIEGNIYNYNGTVVLTPSGATAPDITTAPIVQNNIDLYSNWVNLQNAWGTQWNTWQTLSSTATDTLISASGTDSTSIGANQTVDGQSGGQYGGTLNTTTTQTLQTTQNVMQLLGTALSTSPEKNTNLDLGTFLTSASITPFIPGATIQFEAHGMKPNTQVYAYFNNVPVTAHCAPVKTGYDPSTIDGSQLCYPYGTPLYTDAVGYIHGIFNIQPATFQSGELTFKLVDIYDLSQGQDAITTEADGIYYGRTLSLGQRQSLLNTRSTVISSTEVKSDTFTQNGTQVGTDVTQQFIPDPPPASAGGSGCGCSCFTSPTLVMLASGKEITIDRVKIGDLVFNKDKTAVNTVKFIEIVNDKYFEKLYSPTANFEPFATVNHPLYIDGELASVDPEKNFSWYPWLGKNKKIEVNSIVDVSNTNVYNLWVDGDGSYIVNGYGTSSIIGDGGLLRLCVEQGYITATQAAEIMYHYTSSGKSTVYGVYLLNKFFGKLDIKIANKIFAKLLSTDNIGRTICDKIFKMVGITVCLVK